METDEESETEEDYKRRREFIHAYLTMDNENKQVKWEETETEGDIVETPEEQKKRLIQAYLTSTMEEGETAGEQNERQKLIHAYSKRTMDNDEEQTEQDETETYLRTSMEEEQKPSTWEEYNEEEPFEEYDEDEPFEENDDEGKWTTQFSYPTKEEENTLFIAFMTGNIEDQKKWINAKMNLAKTTTDEETRRREEEILNRIIPTKIMDLDEPFEAEDEEEMDDLSENRPYNLDMDQEEDSILKDYQIYPSSLPEQEKSDEFIDENTEEEDIQSLEPLNISYRNHRRQDEETVNSLTTAPDGQLDKARYFSEPDVHRGYDNEHIEDKREMTRINQTLFEPTVIFSSPYSPTTSQIKMNETFQSQKSDYQTIETKEEQDIENTRRSRESDLFTEQEGCTPWVVKTEHEGILYFENQPQTNPTKLDGIAEWPTPTTAKEVES